MNLQTKWYKVKYLHSNGQVYHYIVNLPQLMSLIIGVEFVSNMKAIFGEKVTI